MCVFSQLTIVCAHMSSYLRLWFFQTLNLNITYCRVYCSIIIIQVYSCIDLNIIIVVTVSIEFQNEYIM